MTLGELKKMLDEVEIKFGDAMPVLVKRGHSGIEEHEIRDCFISLYLGRPAAFVLRIDRMARESL